MERRRNLRGVMVDREYLEASDIIPENTLRKP